jgi:uncharacterized membrane protein YkoI
VVPLSLQAQSATSGTPAQMQKEAKVSFADAQKTALKEVPGAHVKSHELEHEKGKLIYSFDMKTTGKSGVEEINIDALTGAVVAKEHETKKQEKAEAAKSGTQPPAKKP